MKTPHVHAAVIKAWADGDEIQYKTNTRGAQWQEYVGSPSWFSDWEYRVKPEPKPDIVKYFMTSCDINTEKVFIVPMGYEKHANIKCVFDGETHQLKSVELLNDRS